jgi:hypothetical protein
MIAFQVSRRRRSTYQRNKADPSRLRRFGVASLGRRLIARPVMPLQPNQNELVKPSITILLDML